jgi:hypothetical protein
MHAIQGHPRPKSEFVRFPDPDDNPNIVAREDHEVQIDNRTVDGIRQMG